MKKLGKENVITIIKLNGIENYRATQNKTVYKYKGQEVVHYVTWYRNIIRDERGQAYLIVDMKTIHSTKPSFLMARKDYIND